MQILEGITQDYDWGSPTAIPDLLGRPPTGEPVAELWLGAHPSAPSRLHPDGTPLDRHVAQDPVSTLGAETAAAFGRLPFLLKILAASAPLSLQAHPSAALAAEGFAREEAAGIPIDAPTRSFRDTSHKPELICALTEFDALCGFRPPEDTIAVFDSIGTPGLGRIADRLRADGSPAGIGRVLEGVLALDDAAASALVGPMVEACGDGGDDDTAVERALVVDLARRHPGDAGVVIALMLNRVTLQPNDALFLGAGNLHMYLGGVGIEVMANSDNVLRGGLTSKPVDVASLIQVVDPSPITPEIQRPALVDGVATYASPVPEFSLQRIELDGRAALDGGPAIVFCLEGRAEGPDLVLARGVAAWIPATDGPVAVHGTATLYRAGLGRPVPPGERP